MKVMKAVVKCTSAAVKNWISWCLCAGIIHLKSPIGSYFVPSAFFKAHFRITGYPNPILLDFPAEHSLWRSYADRHLLTLTLLDFRLLDTTLALTPSRLQNEEEQNRRFSIKSKTRIFFSLGLT